MIHDLAGLTLEVTNLERAVRFYQSLFGFPLRRHDPAQGVAEFALPSGQTLNLWKPLTRQANDPRLAQVGARGGTHVHFALQLPKGQRNQAQACLRAWGIAYQEINLADEGHEPDIGLYFFDPFGHGLELREVIPDPSDPRFPTLPPGKPPDPQHLPVVGLREVALTFQDFAAMKRRLVEVYGFVFVEELPERAFAQFVLGPQPERDGNFTPRRWLYGWDPQVGLADMLGGEHATVRLLADLGPLEARVKAAGLPYLRDEQGLAVRDPEGHVFEFVPPESNRGHPKG